MTVEDHISIKEHFDVRLDAHQKMVEQQLGSLRAANEDDHRQVHDGLQSITGGLSKLTEQVAIQNGRVTKLETHKLAADIERDTIRRVATEDRDHNAEIADRRFSRIQVIGIVMGVVCGLLAAFGGALQLFTHLMAVT